jgi:hypothetical protein
MSVDRVGKVLERVAREQREKVGDFLEGEESGEEDALVENDLLSVLEERLGPLLRAGQAMREIVGAPPYGSYWGANWDAALAALERERSK